MNVQTNSLNAWVLASRPKTLGAIICPAVLGHLMAYLHHDFSLSIFVVSFSCCLLLQILSNIANDYGDFVRGSDAGDRLGPPRAMQMGWITPKAMHKGILLVITTLVVLGSWIIYERGILIALTGSLAIALALGYTLGPRPLAYLGFSEILIFIIFGPAVMGCSYFVQTGHFDAEVFLLSLSPAFLSTALMLTNNTRDLVQDRANQKLSSAVRLGESFSRRAIVSLVIWAALGPLLLFFLFSYSWPILISLGALVPPISKFALILHEPLSRRFNEVLASIGASLYLFAILASLGLIYG